MSRFLDFVMDACLVIAVTIAIVALSRITSIHSDVKSRGMVTIDEIVYHCEPVE